MTRKRLRDLGIVVGQLPTGPHNAITDVAGVRVGFAQLVRDRPRVTRSGVTMVWPAGIDIWTNYVFAGGHSFNGNGEMTGLVWIAEQGLLGAPIGITNTYDVGTVRDAITAYAVAKGAPQDFHLPVAGETYDGWLSDIASFAVTKELAFQALDAAASGPVAEGNVGGGTGMIAHEFKGGTGTASRVVAQGGESFTVGAIVQANYGQRELLRIAGVPVGLEIPISEIPSPKRGMGEGGSIIVILATDAPLLPIQCQRLARRATTGLAWVGGIGGNGSGDIFLAFATGNRVRHGEPISTVRMIAPDRMTGLFQAAAEATEEAILNAMTGAETMTGFRGRTVHALPLDRVQDIMRKYRRL